MTNFRLPKKQNNDTTLSIRLSKIAKLELQRQATLDNRTISSYVKDVLLKLNANQIKHLKK